MVIRERAMILCHCQNESTRNIGYLHFFWQAGVPCVVVPIKEFEIHVEILGVRIFVHRGMTCFHPE